MRACPAKRSGGHRRRRTRILVALVSRFKVVATLLPRLRLRGPPFGFRSLPLRLDRPRSAAVRAPLSPQASHASSSLAPQPFVASRSRFFSAPFRAVILHQQFKGSCSCPQFISVVLGLSPPPPCLLRWSALSLLQALPSMWVARLAPMLRSSRARFVPRRFSRSARFPPSIPRALVPARSQPCAWSKLGLRLAARFPGWLVVRWLSRWPRVSFAAAWRRWLVVLPLCFLRLARARWLLPLMLSPLASLFLLLVPCPPPFLARLALGFPHPSSVSPAGSFSPHSKPCFSYPLAERFSESHKRSLVC